MTVRQSEVVLLSLFVNGQHGTAINNKIKTDLKLIKSDKLQK